MVRREDVEEVVSAPEGVNAIRTDSESAEEDPAGVREFCEVVVGVAVGGRDAVTGTRLRFAVDRFGFLMAIRFLCLVVASC